MRRSAENKLQVIAVRIDPVIDRRLRLLAEVTGRKQSFFLQQMIEKGIDAMEEVWLPPAVLADVRSGALAQRPPSQADTPDLFGAHEADQEEDRGHDATSGKDET